MAPHPGRSEATYQDAATQNLKIDTGMRSNTRGDVGRKYRDEPNPNTSTVANRAGQDRIGGVAGSLKAAVC
jgi:hypothetical protein